MKKRQKEERAAEGGREGEARGGRRGGQGHAEEGGGHGTYTQPVEASLPRFPWNRPEAYS